MIRVLLVDDQELVRSGFRAILGSEPGIEVVGEAANGGEAVTLSAELQPDVICMDVEMPAAEVPGVGVISNGIEASRQILAATASAIPASKSPAPKSPPSILVLTTFGHEEYLFDALAAGVSGFLLKTSRAEQLIDAVKVLASGGSLLGPEVTGAVLSRVRAGTNVAARADAASSGTSKGGGPERADGENSVGDAPGNGELESAIDEAGLTERERTVLLLIAEGRTNAEIAAELFLGEATVKTHVSNVLQKLGVRDRLQAVVWAHTR